MPKHIHQIEAESMEELCSRVAELNAKLNPTVETKTVAAAPAVKEGAKSSGKAAKKEKEPPAATAAEEATPAASEVTAQAEDDDLFGDKEEAPAAPKVFTAQDTADSLKAVIAKHGVQKAKEVLAKFKVPKASELKEDQYAGFVAACEAMK